MVGPDGPESSSSFCCSTQAPAGRLVVAKNHAGASHGLQGERPSNRFSASALSLLMFCPGARWIVLSALALLLLAPGYAQHSQSVEQRVFQAINQVRQENKLLPLKWNAKIAEVARSHSRRMASRRFFSHEDPQFGGPSDRLSAAGIAWRMCGENIFEEHGEADPVRSAVRGWMASSGHRKNILTRGFTYTGVGVAIGRDGSYTITQMFAAF